MMSRRRFIRATLASAAAAAITGLYTWQVEPHWLELVRRPLPIRRLPDLVVFTGDFTSWHPEVLDQMGPVYDEAPHGRLATLGILGNHDHGPGWSHPEVAVEVAGILGRRGVRILRNEIQEVSGLTVAGLDDLWAGRFRPVDVTPRLVRDRPSIVLSHSPDTVDLPGWSGYEGWVLAGHTHGGQCRPPFLPPPILPVKNPRYTAGEVDVGAGLRLFNVRPEVTVFRTQKA
jgi:uncharacterized protein